MKKTTSNFLLTLLLLFVGSNAWADESWVKTDPENLQTGDVVAIVDLTRELVMPNNNGASAAPAATAITFNDDKTEIAAEVAETWQWVVTTNAVDSTFQFSVEGTEDYLYCTNTNNGLRVGKNENNVFTFKPDENDVLFLFNKGTGRYIGPYQTQDWRCYTSINNNIKGTVIAFYKKVTSGVVVAKPHISPAGGVFTEPQEVTITSEGGNSVFYTLDGTDPTNGSIPYTAPFVVNANCTVKAIAYDANGNASSIASAVFKFPQAMTTIAEVCAAATADKEPVLIEFNNWICTGVAGTNAYFTDGKNGILLYQSNHGFAMNDVLTGTAQVTLTIYNDCPELIGLTATTEGVTVTKGEGAMPMNVIISDLEKNMQGNLITLEGVTYNAEGNVFIDDDDNEVIPYNRFITLPELLDGKIYNVTGVAIWYKNKGKWEIAPRTADEFKLMTSQIAPISYWDVESAVVDVTDSIFVQFTTNSDGVVTYASSDTLVATINQWGKITPVGRGHTTITAYVSETETYLADSKSFTLTVTQEGYADAFFNYNDSDIIGQGAPNTGAELMAVRNDINLYANKAHAKEGDNHIKIYGSKYEGSDEEKQLTEPSFIQLTANAGYSIVKIVLTATEEGYIKEWKDQFGTDAVIDGTTATWEGDWDNVILTNQAPSQARIKSIAVTYIDVEIIDGIVSPFNAKEGKTAIYNLAGQRLQKLQKGINIVGGKKIAVK